MRFGPYTNQETAVHGYTHWFEITADDLTMTTTATAQTFTMPYVFAVGECVREVATDLKPAFADASDSAFNDDTFSIGDASGGVATILSAIQGNVNGTEILHKRVPCSSTALTGFTTAAALTVTFNSMTAKSLVNIDTGVLFGSLQIINPLKSADALSSVLIGK